MENPILNNIIPYISKEERYILFITVDKLLEGNYKAKAKALEVKQSAYYQYKKKKLFCWNDIPGSGNKYLKQFLKNIHWVKTAKIDKPDENIIRISKSIKGNVNFIVLRLNDEKTVTIDFGNGKIEEFVVEGEDGKLNIYKKNLEISDEKTILLLKILDDKNAKKFAEFLIPIVSRGMHQFSVAKDWINSELDFKICEKLFIIHQKYEAKKNELKKRRYDETKNKSIA